MKIFCWTLGVVMALLFLLQAANGWSAWAAPMWPLLWAYVMTRESRSY